MGYIDRSDSDSAHKHAVTGTSNGNIYSYDQNGNQTSRRVGGTTYTLIYNAENRLVQVKLGRTIQATYTYNGDGNRVKTVVGSTTTAFVGNILEWTGSATTMKKYYYASGQRVAMRQGSSTLYHLLTDHLGSTAITATSAGGFYTELRYYPWGGTRYSSGTTPTSFRYTGQREAEVGLYYYGARYYDPSLGRFVQADSIIPNPRHPLSFDRFAYVQNNPIKYTDPSGHNLNCGVPGSAATDDDCAEAHPNNDGEILLFPEIDPNVIPDIGHLDAVIENYQALRAWLYQNYGWLYIDRITGMISDQVIIAFLIAAEFGATTGDLFGEALEALSNQYHSTGPQTPCGGACTLGEQLTWLQTMEGFYSADQFGSILQNEDWLNYLSEAGDAISGYQYGEHDSSWVWGNRTVPVEPGTYTGQDAIALAVQAGEYAGEWYVVGGILGDAFYVLTMDQQALQSSRTYTITPEP